VTAQKHSVRAGHEGEDAQVSLELSEAASQVCLKPGRVAPWL
jgi:hypothetical protein